MGRENHHSILSPYIMVQDVKKAAEFYKTAFHFEINELAPGDKEDVVHAELSYKNQLIMLGKQGAWGGTSKSPATSGVESPISLYLYTADVDAFYKHALQQHAESVIAPDDMFWGDRMCSLKDIDGYVWCFATKKCS